MTTRRTARRTSLPHRRALRAPARPGSEDGAAGGRGPGDPDDDAGYRHDPVVGPEHAGPQPVQPPGGAATMRLPGVRCPPLGGRLDLSIRGHDVISTHVSH